MNASGARGDLRIYLGAAPGVGKTYAMLDEARRRAERGCDVVVGFVETHGRAHTAEQLGDLPVLPRKPVAYRGSSFEELDLDAVLARHPELVLVDELAHTNVPGSGPHEKRWQDVESILAAGIDVLSTVNVQHLESLNDVVETITGVPQRETVPDSVVRAAEQVQLVDMTPEALRRRMAHGNIYRPEKVDAALGNYFRPGNLTALRELALLWLADRVEEGLQRYRDEHGITGVWETRERIVVALTGGPEGNALIRRAARIAVRGAGADLVAVHVARSDGLAAGGTAGLETLRLLVESLGGTYHSLVGEDVPRTLLEFARGVDATQIVLGASRRRPWAIALAGPGTGQTVTRLSGPIDVHIVSHDYAGRGMALPRPGYGLTRRRQIIGFVTAGSLMLAATLALTATRGRVALATDLSISRSSSSRASSAGSGPRCSPRSRGACCSTSISPSRCTRSRSRRTTTWWRCWCSSASPCWSRESSTCRRGGCPRRVAPPPRPRRCPRLRAACFAVTRRSMRCSRACRRRSACTA
jgi:two-component system sensor histidine kinase KdpD